MALRPLLLLMAVRLEQRWIAMACARPVIWSLKMDWYWAHLKWVCSTFRNTKSLKNGVYNQVKCCLLTWKKGASLMMPRLKNSYLLPNLIRNGWPGPKSSWKNFPKRLRRRHRIIIPCCIASSLSAIRRKTSNF